MTNHLSDEQKIEIAESYLRDTSWGDVAYEEDVIRAINHALEEEREIIYQFIDAGYQTRDSFGRRISISDECKTDGDFIEVILHWLKP